MGRPDQGPELGTGNDPDGSSHLVQNVVTGIAPIVRGTARGYRQEEVPPHFACAAYPLSLCWLVVLGDTQLSLERAVDEVQSAHDLVEDLSWDLDWDLDWEAH